MYGCYGSCLIVWITEMPVLSALLWFSEGVTDGRFLWMGNCLSYRIKDCMIGVELTGLASQGFRSHLVIYGNGNLVFDPGMILVIIIASDSPLQVLRTLLALQPYLQPNLLVESLLLASVYN